MKYQLGGKATAPWLVATLLVAGLLSAAMNIYMLFHQTIEIQFPESPPPKSHPPVDWEKDTGRVHIFPDDGDPSATCTFVNYQCWVRI
jgi:hypothetical protein